MKIDLQKRYDNYWRYFINEYAYTKEQYDYIFKYLDFNKLNKYCYAHFNNEVIAQWFEKTYIDNRWLEEICKESPLGYEYLKKNWSKGVFKVYVYYPDKQELKTIINRVINVSLLTGDI